MKNGMTSFLTHNRARKRLQVEFCVNPCWEIKHPPLSRPQNQQHRSSNYHNVINWNALSPCWRFVWLAHQKHLAAFSWCRLSARTRHGKLFFSVETFWDFRFPDAKANLVFIREADFILEAGCKSAKSYSIRIITYELWLIFLRSEVWRSFAGIT